MFFGYSRVSTEDQAANGTTSLAEQERKARAVADLRGAGTYDFACYSDAGVSGTIPLQFRPQGAKMLADAKQGDVIIAAKLDRLFRSTRDAINTAAMLKERGVDLILADLGTDPVTGNGAGKLFFGILAMVAEFERERIQERTNDGRKSKFARGGHLGGSPPYGFKVVGSGREATLQEIPEEQDTIRKIRRLINEHTPASACRTALQMGLRDRAGSPFRIGQMQRIASRYVGINDIYEENGVAVRG